MFIADNTQDEMTLNGVEVAKANLPRVGVCVLLLNARKIPPHIGMVKDGAYFSLSMKGKETAVPLDRIERVIREKQMEVLMVRVRNQKKEEKGLGEIISEHPDLQSSGLSCLSPIREWFRINKGYEGNAQVIFQLLEELDNRDDIEEIRGLGMDNVIENGKVVLKKYDMADVQRRIQNLEKAQR